MENSEINRIKESKKISKTDYVYLSVIITIITIITIIFFHSTSFLVKNINKIFISNDTGSAESLDINRYSLIEKKLNLPKNNQVNPVLNTEIEQATPKNESAIEYEGDKKNIKINIINTTTKVGIASVLSKELETSGFSKSTTESNKILSLSTIIYIKDGQKEYRDSIINIVKKSYPKAIVKTNPENSTYDVIIKIGK